MENSIGSANENIGDEGFGDLSPRFNLDFDPFEDIQGYEEQNSLKALIYARSPEVGAVTRY